MLVHYDYITKVKDGDTWLVKLEHRDLYAVAHPIDRIASSESPIVRVVERRTPTSIVKAGETPVPVAVKPAAFAPNPNRAMPHMFLKPEDRVAIFVDGANMDGASRDAGYHLDYFKVGAFLRGKASFRSAFYYIADFTAQDPLQIRFLDFLAHSGYIVRKKPVKVMEDKETGAKTYKANVDTEMVLDMVNTADNYDVAFLLSGDSDFERCVDLLRSRGKRIYVVTSEKAISRELSHVADKPIFFIDDYQDLLARDEK